MNYLFNFPGNFGKHKPYANPLLWIIFLLYIMVMSFAMRHHELWGDEFHSWNIAKASTNFSDLIYNIRYEGHPPVWYTVLWFISKFTRDVTYIQLAQLIIACLVVFVVLFYSPFPLITKILIPFGYYFLFEYGVLSRNYAIAVLMAFCICLVIQREFPYKLLVYYVLLLIMSNTHLIAAFLAVNLHLYFLLYEWENKKNKKIISFHILTGTIIFLSTLYFIFPPSDSSSNMHFWINSWEMIRQLKVILQIPLRAFIPIPAWWNFNFWNTEFLLDAQNKYSILKLVSVLILITTLGALYSILKGNKKSLILFTANLILNFAIAIIFPLSTQRYVGFTFIGFIAAYWLYAYESPSGLKNKLLINALLVIQIIAGVFSIFKDIQYPFSNSYRLNELLSEVPVNDKIVTDLWCFTTISAITDKPFYCIGYDREISFLLWNSEFKKILYAPNLYYESLTRIFENDDTKKVYLISIRSPQMIYQKEPQLSKLFHLQLIDKREGSIESQSDLYLLQITPF